MNATTKLSDLKPHYEDLWFRATILPNWKGQVDQAIATIQKGADNYKRVTQLVKEQYGGTLIDWRYVAVIHYLEGGCNFASHLHNGDSLKRKTVQVPRNRPLHPPASSSGYTWVESAIDALTMPGKAFHTIKDNSIAAWLWRLEGFNGFGYRLYHPEVGVSPYLASGTQFYKGGKYESDGRFNPKLVSAQVGVVPLLKILMAGSVSSVATTPTTATDTNTAKTIVNATVSLPTTNMSMNMSKRLIVTNLEGTFLKVEHKQAIELDEKRGEKFHLPYGTVLPVLSIELDKKHAIVTLQNNAKFFVYTGHCEIEDALSSPSPTKSNNVITTAQTPITLNLIKPPTQAVTTLPAKAKPRTLAEKVLAYMEMKKYEIAKGKGEINLVGIEGIELSGKVNRDDPDQFNDLVGLILFNGNIIEGHFFEGTTEPGRHFTERRMNPLGAARLAFGQYKAWRVGMHGNGGSRHKALVQVGNVKVYRDDNEDFMRVGDKLYEADDLYLNIHWGYGFPRKQIQTASAGCQTIREWDKFMKFMGFVLKDPRYLRNAGFIFPYTLIPGDDLLKHFP